MPKATQSIRLKVVRKVTALVACLVAAYVAIAAWSEESARAQTGAACNADRVIGSCRATITGEGNWLTVTSSTTECSVVDWYSGPQPQTTVVVGGMERVERLLMGAEPRPIEVASCRVVETLVDADFSDQMVTTTAKCYCEQGVSTTVTVEVPRNASRDERQALGERACAPYTQMCQARTQSQEAQAQQRSQACNQAMNTYNSSAQQSINAFRQLRDAAASAGAGGNVNAYCAAARQAAATNSSTVSAGQRALSLCEGRRGYDKLQAGVQKFMSANADAHVANCAQKGL